MATDPYVYPGSNVLRNLAGIDKRDQLDLFEAVSTTDRILELHVSPIQGAFDIDHLQRIHRHIFQDVYDWAGEFRTVDIRKEGEFWFCRHEFIEQSLNDLFGRLRAENNLKSASPSRFGSRAGYYMNELNAVHPFREGNGRAQREFIRELGVNAGLSVDWARVTQEEMYSASVAGFKTGDSQPMEELITRITSTAVD
jgi:cell filamentation protein